MESSKILILCVTHRRTKRLKVTCPATGSGSVFYSGSVSVSSEGSQSAGHLLRKMWAGPVQRTDPEHAARRLLSLAGPWKQASESS